MMQILKRWLSSFDSINKKTLNNQIIFEIDKDQQINISIELHDLSSSASQTMGDLFFLLNEGYYVQHILETLTTIANQNKENTKFVQAVINVWSSKVLSSDINTSDIDIINNETPVISPSQFSVGK